MVSITTFDQYIEYWVRTELYTNNRLYQQFASKGDWRGWVDNFYKQLSEIFNNSPLIDEKMMNGRKMTSGEFVSRGKTTLMHLVFVEADANVTMKGFLPKPVFKLFLEDSRQWQKKEIKTTGLNITVDAPKKQVKESRSAKDVNRKQQKKPASKGKARKSNSKSTKPQTKK